MQHDLKVFTTALSLSLTALTPALAEDGWTQLIETAGLAPAEAQGLSLEQIAIYEHNRSSRRDDAIGVRTRRGPVPVDPLADAQLIYSARLSPDDAGDMTLREVFAYKLDLDNTEDLHLAKANEPELVDPNRHAQLIAAVGLSPADAAGMKLSSVVLLKFQHESD